MSASRAQGKRGLAHQTSGVASRTPRRRLRDAALRHRVKRHTTLPPPSGHPTWKGADARCFLIRRSSLQCERGYLSWPLTDAALFALTTPNRAQVTMQPDYYIKVGAVCRWSLLVGYSLRAACRLFLAPRPAPRPSPLPPRPSPLATTVGAASPWPLTESTWRTLPVHLSVFVASCPPVGLACITTASISLCSPLLMSPIRPPNRRPARTQALRRTGRCKVQSRLVLGPIAASLSQCAVLLSLLLPCLAPSFFLSSAVAVLAILPLAS